MQINNNPTSFKSVKITEPAMQELCKRMPAGKFVIGVENFKTKYKNSPVSLVIDIFEKENPRLDATISYKKGEKEDLVHIMENQFSYLLNLNPAGFLKKAGKELEAMEKEFCIAKQ